MGFISLMTTFLAPHMLNETVGGTMGFRFYATILIVIFFLTGSPANADGASSFALFQSLRGTWGIWENGQPLSIKMTYDMASRDSVVTEHFGKELTVFHIDKSDLLATHYCNRGNQPRLKLTANTAPNVYEFEMIDITNLDDPNDPHVHKMIYRFIDKTHFDLEIVWKAGSVQESENYSLIKE